MDNFPKKEIRELEQYFFSENVIQQLTSILQYENNILCLCTPSLADAFYKIYKKEVLCLDIDERFSYLPNFKKCDITNLNDLPISNDYFPDLIIVDPPFFKMKIIDLYNCIEKITKGNKNVKIVIAYVIREEKNLLSIFKSYNLQLTKFKLEYANVDSAKWSNYGIYSNFESGKIKFLNKKKINK